MSRAILSAIRPADSATIFFCIFLLALTAANFGEVANAGTLVILYSSLIVFQIVLVLIAGMNRFLTVTRDIIFPVIAILVLFDTLGLIVHVINRQDIDHLLIRADYAIFGAYMTVALEKIMHPALSDLLQLAYSTYYFMPVVLGIALKMRRQHEDFDRFLALVLFCFYLSYIGYMLFPALGPRYALEHLQSGPLRGLAITDPIQRILNVLEGVKRDAFPSGHTGIALTVLFCAWRYHRTAFRILLAPVILLVIATMYCRYHYAVDVLGGMALTVVTLAGGTVYYKFWNRIRHGYSAPHNEGRDHHRGEG